MKKILMLGGTHFQVPAIEYAKKAGYYVITADYVPENPGHRLANEYHNVSTTDFQAILSIAEGKNIDGILSYASDPAAPTAAYVAEKMGLPGNPLDSVIILQRKDKFRKFLSDNGFLVPRSFTFSQYHNAIEFAEFLLEKNAVVVKPSDSSGSKGVSKIEKLHDLLNAFNYALAFSRNKLIVIEDFITKATYEMDGDGFVWNGKLSFRCFGNQHNDLDCNPYVPVGISFPYVQEERLQKKAHSIIETILTKLNMKLGGLNLEYLTDSSENLYILEIGPRNGGNLIPEVIKYATGVDLIELAVESALGKDCSNLSMLDTKGYYSSYILHSQNAGVVKDIIISEDIKKHIIQENIMIKLEDKVSKFNGSNNTLGTFILKFSSIKEMTSLLDGMNNHIKVITRNF